MCYDRSAWRRPAMGPGDPLPQGLGPAVLRPLDKAAEDPQTARLQAHRCLRPASAPTTASRRQRRYWSDGYAAIRQTAGQCLCCPRIPPPRGWRRPAWRLWPVANPRAGAWGWNCVLRDQHSQKDFPDFPGSILLEDRRSSCREAYHPGACRLLDATGSLDAWRVSSAQEDLMFRLTDP